MKRRPYPILVALTAIMLCLTAALGFATPKPPKPPKADDDAAALAAREHAAAQKQLLVHESTASQQQHLLANHAESSQQHLLLEREAATAQQHLLLIHAATTASAAHYQQEQKFDQFLLQAAKRGPFPPAAPVRIPGIDNTAPTSAIQPPTALH